MEDAAIVLDEPDDIEPPVGAPQSNLKLADLTRPPGLVGEIIDWIEASAEYPSREADLGAAIGIVATIIGRRVAASPSEARTNFYMILLAESGYGKNHPGTCAKNLLTEAGLDQLLGPSRFASASGLRKTVAEQPSVFCIQDEYGGFLRQIDGPNFGVHNATIRTDMLEFFSTAESVYTGTAYAIGSTDKIHNPNLSILGMSTPSDFWSAVTSARGADGFLPRFMLFNIDSPKPDRVTPTASKGNPPPRLIERLKALYNAVHGDRKRTRLRG